MFKRISLELGRCFFNLLLDGLVLLLDEQEVLLGQVCVAVNVTVRTLVLLLNAAIFRVWVEIQLRSLRQDQILRLDIRDSGLLSERVVRL